MANPRISDMLKSVLTSMFTDKTAIFSFAAEKEEELFELKKMIEEEKIKPTVDKIYALEQAAEAHRRVETEKRLGPVVIYVKNNDKAFHHRFNLHGFRELKLVKKTIFFNNEFALSYDDLVGKQKWYGAVNLIGMIFKYLKAKYKILDIGIGTGLSATDFYALGLDVYSIDYSNEMLEVCRQKDIAVDLKKFDLNDTLLPYPSNFFDLRKCYTKFY